MSSQAGTQELLHTNDTANVCATVYVIHGVSGVHVELSQKERTQGKGARTRAITGGHRVENYRTWEGK